MPIIRYILNILELTFFLIFQKNEAISHAAIWKENQCLKRTLECHGINQPYQKKDKPIIRLLVLINKECSRYFQCATPNTILYKWRKTLREFWTQPGSTANPGRPPLGKRIKEIILNMKTLNYLWGHQRISHELQKIDMEVCKKTIAKIIQDGRKDGLILPNGSWSSFISSHIQSLFACDFFTVDIWGFKRFYVFFIIQIKTRKIVHFHMTQHPTISYLRRQFSQFESEYPDSWLIHDNSGELKWFPYEEYSIHDVAITPCSPNMNAFAERFIRSIRRECLDWFIIFNERQLWSILKEYMDFYNHYRPHQGLKGRIPDPKPPPEKAKGKIKKKSVLFGLHQHYYRDAS